MTVDPAVIPGLLLLAAEFAALAAVGYVVVRVALRQTDDRMALAQGLVVGLALWGLITNFVLYAVPGLAGAAVGWGLTLILGTVLAWRARRAISLRPRVAAAFAAAFLVLFWLALASRQLLESPDPMLHLGLAAWIRAGGFPPELPWNPGMVVRYHHAADLLVGLLTPPVGPDLAFVQELLGAYAWTSLALVVATALLRRGSWRVALVIAPLLLTAGAWTWTSLGGGILQGPVPAGLPAAGLGASLGEIYWPSVGQSGALEPTALHDIWTPAFTLGYALAFVVLERAARSERLSWLGTLTLGVLVGFIGILVTSLVPVVLVLWAALAAVQVIRERCARGAAIERGAGAGGAAALGRRRRVHGDPRCCAAVRPGSGVGPQSAALGGAGHVRRASRRYWLAGPRPDSSSRRRRAVGPARSAGGDAGGGRRPAGAGLAGAELSAGAVGAEPPGGACPQSGAGGAAARARSSPLRAGAGALALRARRTACGADRLADGCGAPAQSRPSPWERRAAGQRRMGGAGVARSDHGGIHAAVSAADHVGAPGELYPGPAPFGPYAGPHPCGHARVHARVALLGRISGHRPSEQRGVRRPWSPDLLHRPGILGRPQLS